MCSKWVVVCLVLSGIQNALCANILMIEGVPSPSHHIWTRAISLELAKRGHNVTSLSCDVDKDVPRNLHYLHMDTLMGFMDEFDFLEMGEMSTFQMMTEFLDYPIDMWKTITESKGYKQLTEYPNEFKFDLIIYDHIESPGLLVFAEKFKRAALMSASAYPIPYVTNPMTGAPNYPAFVPNQLMDSVEDSFLGRLASFIVYWLDHKIEYDYILNKLDKVIKETYPNIKHLNEIQRNTKIHLINYNPALDFIQPMMPSVIPVGGLQISNPKPLPQDLEEIAQNAKKGIILFSLGSNVKCENLGKETLTEIIEALRQFPDHTFLWKLDDSQLKLELPKNVIIRKWLPQNDILGHNKTVLFMSHGGGLSTQEATWYGVPVLGFPVMLDQFPNVDNLVKAGVGLKLNIKTIDRVTLKDTIQELLTNKKYWEKSKIRSQNFRDQPQSPMERAIWWIEYVLRNPNLDFLKSPIVDMSFEVKHSVDVIAFITIFALLCIYIAILIFKCIFKFIKARNAKVQKQKRS